MSQPFQERGAQAPRAGQRLDLGDGQIMSVSYNLSTVDDPETGQRMPVAQNIRYIVGTEGQGITKRQVVEDLDAAGNQSHRRGVRRYGGAVALLATAATNTMCDIYAHPWLTLITDAALLGTAEYLRRKGSRSMRNAKRFDAKRNQVNDHVPGEYVEVTERRVKPRISFYSRDRRRRPTPKHTK